MSTPTTETAKPKATAAKKPAPKTPATKTAKPAAKKKTAATRPHRAVRLVTRMHTRLTRMVARAEANKARADRRKNNDVTQTAARDVLQILVGVREAFDALMDTTRKAASGSK